MLRSFCICEKLGSSGPTKGGMLQRPQSAALPVPLDTRCIAEPLCPDLAGEDRVQGGLLLLIITNNNIMMFFFIIFIIVIFVVIVIVVIIVLVIVLIIVIVMVFVVFVLIILNLNLILILILLLLLVVPSSSSSSSSSARYPSTRRFMFAVLGVCGLEAPCCVVFFKSALLASFG